MQKPGRGFVRRDADIIEAFTRRSFLAFQESGKFDDMVKNEAIVDAMWICNSSFVSTGVLMNDL